MTVKRLIRVFPRRTTHTPRDPFAFVGDPPLFRPSQDEVSEVHISVTFTWDIKDAERLARAWGALYPVVKMGGPALDNPEERFVPGRYIKRGVTFTTRGCNRKCPWCRVPAREGRLSEFMEYPDGWIIQDNNFLQASREHQSGVFNMLRRLPENEEYVAHCRRTKTAGIEFAGGIDCRLVTPWFAEQLKTIRLHQLFLAADTKLAIHDLERAREILNELPRSKMRTYTLIGFGNDTIEKATARLERVWDLGCIPHAQLYQPEDRWISYSREWRMLSRLWSRPATMHGLHRATQTITDKMSPLFNRGGGR